MGSNRALEAHMNSLSAAGSSAARAPGREDMFRAVRGFLGIPQWLNRLAKAQNSPIVSMSWFCRPACVAQSSSGTGVKLGMRQRCCLLAGAAMLPAPELHRLRGRDDAAGSFHREARHRPCWFAGVALALGASHSGPRHPGIRRCSSVDWFIGMVRTGQPDRQLCGHSRWEKELDLPLAEDVLDSDVVVESEGRLSEPCHRATRSPGKNLEPRC